MKIDSPNSKGISTGFGIPTGGTSNQVLVKNSSSNYDTSWGSATSEGLYQAFTGITQGRAVKLGTDGKIYPTDFVGVEDQPIIGIAQTSGATNSFVRVILEGGLSTITSGLTPSYNYYADTNGSISLTGETYVGTALSGNTLQVSFGSSNGATTPSLNVIDNTITDPANITAPGRYIVPVSGTTGEFVGESNDYADYDGVGFTFTIPTNNDKALISTGPNSGNVYLFTSGMTSGWTLSSQSTTLPTSNWAIGIAYKQFDLVIYQNFLYQANGTIPANTAFNVGTSGATWKPLNNGVIPEYGNVYPASGSTTSSSSFADLSGSTLNLPSAGTYRVYYNMSVLNGTVGGNTSFVITDSSNTTYNGSAGNTKEAAGATIAVMASQEVFITVNAPTSLKMRWKTNGTGTATLINNNTTSNSVFGYEKIAGFAPVVGQTSNYRSATLSTALVGGGLIGQDMAFVTNSVGTIPLSTSGVWTLTAGVTYQIMSSVSYDAEGTNQFQGDTEFAFVDATTNTVLPNQTNGTLMTPFFTTRGLSRRGTIIFQYTPSSNQTIKLRVLYQLNTGTLRAQTSVNQLGTTNTSAFTGVISPSWNIGNTYALGSMVVNQGVLYQANSLVPAGTIFTSGSSGATWTQIGLLNGQAEYGENYLTSNVTVNNTQTTILTANIPSAGVWNINYYANINFGSGSNPDEGRVWLADSSGTIINGSGSYGYITSQSNMGAVYSNQITLTTTSATTITLRGLRLEVAPMTAMGTLNVATESGLASPAGTKISWNKIAGFLPASSGVPNWSTIGTIQSVGISAVTTAPTIPTNTTTNTIMYKQLGSKTHSVRGSIAIPSTLTGNNIGNGDYLLTLPNGLQFDTSVVGQSVYSADNLANSINFLLRAIPGSYAAGLLTAGGTATQGWPVGIVPYSSTQYRVLLPILNNSVRCWGSTWFQFVVGNTTEVEWQFDFQST
jgi:hypothetical protein